MNAAQRQGNVRAVLEPRSQTLLQSAEHVLRRAGRSMHSREIAQAIIDEDLSRLTGKTPWKTVTARISMDIRRQGSTSPFMRTSHGLFALRDWEFALEFEVKRRTIAPIDETIRVLSKTKFESFKSEAKNDSLLYAINYQALIEASIEMSRHQAEQTDAFIQLIPTFLVRCGDKIWTYTRTKRLPEARLHHARCVSFGGHMQAEDELYLFRGADVYRDSVLRELYEELAFSRAPAIRYLGTIHLTSNLFERQHAGLVFEVVVDPRTRVASLEPGRHTDVRLTDLTELRQLAPSLDSWSQLLVQVLNEPG